MAIILYPNGITEEYLPTKETFTKEDLAQVFLDYDTFGSIRMVKILNAWMLYGKVNQGRDDLLDYYNKLASTIFDIEIYSQILFIHDTEINSNWKITDDIIHFNYSDFKKDILQMLDETAEEIIKNTDSKEKQIMYLKQIGVSGNKKIIFELDPDEQHKNFYTPEVFREFADKIIKYFKTDYIVDKSFSLFSDKNVIILTQDSKVKTVINKLLSFFNSMEEYENSKIVKDVYKGWIDFNTETPIEVKPKRKRKKKVKKDSIDKDKKL